MKPMITKKSNPVSILLFALILLCSSCGGDEQVTEQADIPFDKAKWAVKKEGQYTYRKQMINDLLKNHKWEGVTKDSVVQMLGKPDAFEEGNLLMYNYELKPFLAGLGTTIEALVFELEPDSTVKVARLNDGGWD